MKILPMETEFIHADGRTGMTKLIVALAVLRTRMQTIYMYKRICKWSNVDIEYKILIFDVNYFNSV